MPFVMPHVASSGAAQVTTPQVRGLGGKDPEAARQMFDAVASFAKQRNARRLEAKQDAANAEAKQAAAKQQQVKEQERSAIIRILDPGNAQESMGADIAHTSILDRRQSAVESAQQPYGAEPPQSIHSEITPAAMAMGGDRTGVRPVAPSPLADLPIDVLKDMYAEQRASAEPKQQGSVRDFMEELKEKLKAEGQQARAKMQGETARAVVVQQLKNQASAKRGTGTASAAQSRQNMVLEILGKVDAGEQLSITERTVLNKYTGAKSIEEVALDLKQASDRNRTALMEPLFKYPMAEWVRQAVKLRETVGLGTNQPRTTTRGLPVDAAGRASAADFDLGP